MSKEEKKEIKEELIKLRDSLAQDAKDLEAVSD